jgi:glycosyltransferase 2 family protein
MNKKILSLLRYMIFLGLGVVLVFLSVRNITDSEWFNIKKALVHARYWLIFPVMATLLLSHYSRARRWRILIEPLGYKPRVANTYMAVLIGYLANLAIPRLGEVLKCTILSRYEKVPADKLVGTILAERAFDVLCLIVVIIITILTQVDLIGGYMHDLFSDAVANNAHKFTWGRIGLVAGILIVVLFTILYIFKKYAHISFMQKLKAILTSIWHGITSIRYLKSKGWFIFHTVFIWSMYLLSVRIGMYAIQETSVYGLKESLSVLTTGSLAIIVPTPGQGFGVYQWVVQKTMALYGLQEGLGLAFGYMLWTAQFFQILLSGFFASIIIPWFNKKYPHAG